MTDNTGISLLSMYNDEDDEMEEAGNESEEEEEIRHREDNNEIEGVSNSMEEDTDKINDENNNNNTPNDNITPKEEVNYSERKRRKGRVGIVDYGHDEVAMSPEAEEGEIVGAGYVSFRAEHHSTNGDLQEKVILATVQVSTLSTQTTTPQSGQLTISEADTLDYDLSEPQVAAVDDGAEIAEDLKDIDPLDKFLPSPPVEKCSQELQERINKFLALKRSGKSYNAEVRNKKAYRNPDFLAHAVKYQGIDQLGSCFSKEVFDPYGYDKSDYYEEIEADMKRELERREQEKKKSQKVDFITGGTQPGIVTPALKVSLPLQVPTSAASSLQSVPTTADVARDGRQNKKSKWDKVDGDRRSSLPTGGQDSISNVGAHAALLSAANAGAGYTAFAQQRRREAEEKRSSERRRT